jgi:hypothetical protein
VGTMCLSFCESCTVQLSFVGVLCDPIVCRGIVGDRGDNQVVGCIMQVYKVGWTGGVWWGGDGWDCEACCK